MNQENRLKYLNELGFATNPLNKKVKNIDEVWEYFNQIAQKRDLLNYNIDGMVVKINDSKLVEQLGAVGKSPRGWCALKYPAEETTSRIINIVWQIGRTGKLTPVAELDPVLLQGTIVKRATIHNYKEFLNYQFSKGDLVVIRKAGDIIPEIVKIISLNKEKG